MGIAENKRTVEVHFRLPAEKAARLKVLAREKDRPLSQLIKDILNKYLHQHTATLPLLFFPFL